MAASTRTVMVIVGIGRICGILLILMMSGFLVLAYLLSGEAPGVSLFVGATSLLPIVIMLYILTDRVVVAEAGLSQRKLWFRSRSIGWDEVVDASFNFDPATGKRYVFRSLDTSIAINKATCGQTELARMALERLPESVLRHTDRDGLGRIADGQRPSIFGWR